MAEDVKGKEADRGGAATAGPGVAVTAPQAPRPERWRPFLASLVFLAPALILLGFLVVYPIFFSIYRSLYDKAGTNFVGVKNYQRMFSNPGTLTAIRNNTLWLVGPLIVTAVALVLAVLAERIKWSTAFKVVLFMPMAVSALSAGVIWRVVYEQDPTRGTANAAIRSVVDVFRPPGNYPDARPRDDQLLKAQGKALVTTTSFGPGDTVLLGFVGIPPDLVPKDAQTAAPPATAPDAIVGTVWLDFAPGGGGEQNAVDPNEQGLPGMKVEAVQNGSVVGTATSDAQGRFTISGLSGGSYQIELPASNFRPPWGGITWLGATLVTPSIIIAWIWTWTGFAVVTLGAGLAALPRDVLEAARVDGATELQTFRRVTIPLLMPVVLVILVTLIINVLKIFDLVFVIAPGSVQDKANVIALELYRQAFSAINDQGLGSALAIFLLVLVLPAMIFNFRRFRAGQ
jgi:alpha-glucoside transport system permease protein